LTEQEARNLIGKWLEAKKSLFGIRHDKSEVEKITTGIAYNKYVKDESNNLTNNEKNLSNKTIYYTHEKQHIYKIVKIKDQNYNDRVMVRAIITEHRTRHYIKTKKTKKLTSIRNIFCYELTRVDGQWKISMTPQSLENKQACICYKTVDWDDRS
jgi:ARC6-like, IMS domain